MTTITKTAKFTVEQTLEWLRKAVAERGADYNYCETFGRGPSAPKDEHGEPLNYADTSCNYVENGQPGCIAGQVFAYAGIDVECLGRHEGDAADRLAPKFGFTQAAGLVLRQAQILQDEGRTWGEALAWAEQYAKDNDLS